MIESIIPRMSPQIKTAIDIFGGCCPTCGQPLDIAYFHIGGRGQVPHIVCSNPDGGQSSEHVRHRVSDEIAEDYRSLIRDMHEANERWAAEMERWLEAAL